jgi:molybdate transport system substrate-binding protein
MRTFLTMAAAGLLAVAGQGTAQANEITILSTMGSNSGVVELAAAFEKATGHKVKVSFEGGPSLAQKLNTNAPADLIATGPDQLDELTKLGKVVDGTATPFTVAPLGVSVKAGAPKPNISTPEAFKAAMLAAKSVGYSRGCSGTHAAEIIAKLGIGDQMKAKTKLTAGGPVAEYVAKGDFEVGIQQNNVLIGVPGSDFVGALPASIDKPCPFSMGLMKISTQPILARAFITYAVSPAAAPLLRKSLLEPVKGS